MFFRKRQRLCYKTSIKFEKSISKIKKFRIDNIDNNRYFKRSIDRFRQQSIFQQIIKRRRNNQRISSFVRSFFRFRNAYVEKQSNIFNSKKKTLKTFISI